LRRARALLLPLVLVAACYSPSPPPGSYRCGAADQACPRGQHCSCGLCVEHEDEAACSFLVAAAAGTDANAVEEHAPFALTVQALMADGVSRAARFHGTAALAASWGDVRVIGQPAGAPTVELTDGLAQAMVTLNRETLPPQAATIRASFAGNSGTSSKVAVQAPRFARQRTPVAAVPAAARPFGFADVLVAQPDVARDAGGWRMYFGGLSGKGGYQFGVAASSDDGASFAALGTTPVLAAGGAAWDLRSITSPSVFRAGDAVHLAFAGSDMLLDGVNQIGVATSPDGVTPFAFDSAMPTLKTSDCAYCAQGVEFPAVIPDPAGSGWLMFFSVTTRNGSPAYIGRASSSDGLRFVPEPAPLLAGELANEAVLLAPRVLVDGTVFKMWYTFARIADVLGKDLCAAPVNVGYATSDDGFFWVRSPSNPVMPAGGLFGWDDAITAFLVGSVVPSDGADPGNGITLYYSTLRPSPVGPGPASCLPNGIGRATRR
jgi:hypothetical protein